ncbi:thioesterase family protein [soil metagenome]
MTINAESPATSPADPHPFDQAVAFERALSLEGRGLSEMIGATSPAYANMVGPFGGITAAQLLSGVLKAEERRGVPVSITVNFLAPIEDGEFRLVVTRTRENKSSQHWMAELRQGAEQQLRANATVITAVRRDVWKSTEIAMPAAPTPDEVPRVTRNAPLRWVERYDFRFVEGKVPFTGDPVASPSSRSLAWVRDEPPRPVDYASLLALSDSFFPRIFFRRAQRVPIGTVTMTTNFHCSEEDLAAVGTGHVLALAQGQVFFGGFFEQTAQMWSEGGQCLATSHQLVYYRE